jgi:hypothetical protein
MSGTRLRDASLLVKAAEADHIERDVLLTLALIIAAEFGALLWVFF